MISRQDRISKLSPEKLAILANRLAQKQNSALNEIAAQTNMSSSSRIAGNPIPVREDRSRAAMSFTQQRFWFLDQLDPGSPHYILPAAVAINGPLNVSALEHSLWEIARRHDIMRTRFTAIDDAPLQIIDPLDEYHLPVLDLSELPEPARQAQAKELIQASANFAFNLSTGPLFRTQLIKLDENEHLFLLSMHHIITDGWSTGILAREMAGLYQAYAAGEAASFDDLTIQFADYAEWQRNWLRGERLEDQLRYWEQALEGISPVLELPFDFPRPAIETHHGRHIPFTIPTDLAARLRTTARQEQVTPFMLLMAAFQALLRRYSGQETFCVGTPIANRTRPELEGVMGPFVNSLVIRADLRGEPTFSEVLQRVRETCLSAYARQDLPFEVLVERLQVERSLSYSPLFQVMFAYQDQPAEPFHLPGLATRLLPAESEIAKFDLLLTINDDGKALSGNLEFNTDLFRPDTIERMVGHYQTLLAGAIADLNQPVARLPLLTEAEKEQLLVRWNATEHDYAKGGAQQFFEQWAKHQPDAPALIFQDQTLSYQQLDRRANILARRLQALGIGPEKLAGILCLRGFDLITAILAVWKAGGGYVPLDPAYPPDRLGYMLADSDATVLITHPGTYALTQNSIPIDERVKVICIDGAELDKEAADAPQPIGQAGSENLAYIIYTSGSTGRPKGVILRHRGMCSLVEYLRSTFDIQPGNRVLQFSSASFDVSIWDILLALAFGGTLVLASHEVLASPQDLVDLLRKQAVHTATLVPSVLSVLPHTELPALKNMIVAGEACPGELVRDWGPERRFYNAYGPTETTIISACTQCDPTDPLPPTIGRPVYNTRLYILDDNQQPVPVGVYGELYIGGIGVARAYHNRPELTAERFLPDPFSPEVDARMYRTGDRVRFRPDGSVEYLGRLDNQVKIRGFRIELGEIEAALLELPAVKQVVVTARDGKRPGDRRLVAYLVPEVPEERVDANALRTHLKSRLPEYMLPSAFVLLDHMPLNPNKKIDRKALPEPDGHNLIESASAADTQGATVFSPLEELMAGIWSQLLGAARIHREDNFFEIGGHSLMATQLVARVRSLFQVDLPLRALFEAPALGDFTRAVEAIKAQQQPVAQPMTLSIPITASGSEAAVRSEAPLSFTQQRLWFLDQLEPGSPAYNITLPVRIHGPLDLAAFRVSMAQVVMRHAIMRTSFHDKDGEGMQTVAAEVDLPFRVVDLTDHIPETVELEANRLIREEARLPFDLAYAPLFRMTIYRLRPDKHIGLLVIHHIISDGWSTGVIINELAELYQAQMEGRPSRLPELALQYADYAAWQRNALQDKAMDEQVAYWRQQLEGCPLVLELPGDHPRPNLPTFQGGALEFQLPDTLSAALKTLSRQEGVTLFMLLLAAFETFLYRYTGQEEFTVGTPIANRTSQAVEPLIGFFANTLVLRANLSGQVTFRDLLQRVREVCLGAYAHQDTPFELLVNEFQTQRELSHSPLFQVVFVLQNTPQMPTTMPGLALEPMPVDSGVAKFDLTLMMEDGPAGLHGMLEYSSDLFERASVQRMLENFQALLEHLAEEFDQPVDRLTLLSRTERELLFSQWNPQPGPYPDRHAIQQVFETQVALAPHMIALDFEGQPVNYEALNQRANQLAHFLIRQGVEREEIIGLCLDRSVEMIVAILGVIKAGAAYLPLDPEYPPERLAFMIQDSGARRLITRHNLLQTVPTGEAEIIDLDGAWQSLNMEPDTNPPARSGPLDLAYMIYTSGSTGRPKGVLLQHRGLCNLVTQYARLMQLGPGGRMLQFFTYCFDGSVSDIFTALCSGATLCMGRRETMLPGPEMIRFLRERGVTHALITPSALAALPREDLPDLRCLMVGGEACTADILKPWARGRRLINLYGPTEATVIATSYEIAQIDQESTTLPIGRPLPNTRLYILDSHLNPQPLGAVGEIYLGGVGIARGYLGRPELTEQHFLPDPFSNEAGAIAGAAAGTIAGAKLYRTGDLGRFRADGVVEYHGRSDFQVKIRGFRIELGEIEAAMRRHTAIQDAAAWVCEENGVRRLVGYYIQRDSHQLSSISELRDFLKASLPDYMVPAQYVSLGALPMTPSGKIDRKALPEPGPFHPELETSFRAPENETERILAKIWQGVLSIEQVGAEDNFFELGGDSILSLQVVARAREKGLQLSPKLLFEHPTIAELAQIIHPGCAHAVDQGPVSGAYPLTPIQRWFFQRGFPQPGYWNQSVLLRCSHRPELKQVMQALARLIEHHDVLRSQFTHEGPDPKVGWTVEILPAGPAPEIMSFDFSDLASDEQDTALVETCTQLQASLDLARPPLLAAGLIWLGPQRGTRLFLCAHHLVIDTVSWRILLEDLREALTAIELDQPADLPLKTVSFQQWALALEQMSSSAEILNDLHYWERTVQAAENSIPVDEQAAINPEGQVLSESFTLSKEETGQLLRKSSTTAHADAGGTLLAGFAWALREWAGPIRLPILLERHGREEILDLDVSRTAGWFTAIFPLALDLTDLRSPREALDQVTSALRTLPHNGLSYGLLAAAHPDAEIRNLLQAAATPPISFNYLGQFDGLLSGEGFALADEPYGLERDPNADRPHLLDVTAAVRGGQLNVKIHFNPAIHRPTTIQALVGRFATALRDLITQHETSEPAAASIQFIGASVSEHDLKNLMEEIALDFDTED